MIYPPRAAVDEEDHAARVLLLAEACADVPPDWLEYARREWVKTQPFFPRVCELREIAMAYGRWVNPPAPVSVAPALPAPIEPAPDLTPEEIAELPEPLRRMAAKLGLVVVHEEG